MVPNSKFIDRIINAAGGADRLWEERAAILASGELACRAGCFGCCVGLFAIGLPEALALRAAVLDLPADVRGGILARASRALEETATTFPGDAAGGVLDPERSDAAEDAWFLEVRATPCPVLELPSGRCAVYAARPSTCRTYGLALAAGENVLLPACELNLPSASPARVAETAIEAGRLTAVDQALVEIAAEEGFPAGVETTVAHALAGTAFAAFERPRR